jgi:hypothetical protein
VLALISFAVGSVRPGLFPVITFGVVALMALQLARLNWSRYVLPRCLAILWHHATSVGQVETFAAAIDMKIGEQMTNAASSRGLFRIVKGFMRSVEA